MKYNLSKIRGKRAYSTTEVGNLLSINRRTVHRWIKEGLQLLDPTQKPTLIMGYDLKAFIKTKRQINKVTLQPNQYYCLKCRKAIYAKRGSEKVEKTGKKIGKQNREQEIIYGRCKECSGNVARLL